MSSRSSAISFSGGNQARGLQLLEFLFEILGEVLIQIVAEVLVELGLRSTAEPFRKRPDPWVAAVGYATFGAAAGGISLWLFPNHLVRGDTMRLVSLAIAPVVAGLAMAAIGAWRARRGQLTLRLDRFSYGYLFALCMALIRYHFATMG